MSKSRNSQLALGRLTVSAFVSAMLQMCAREALAAGPTQLPIACTGAGVACGTNTTGVNFASYGTATASTSGKTLTVNQTTNTATLNWASFNVTADGKVVFQQPSSSAVALNRIYDANPSSIFGSVSANGQIYLINANGILFGSTATVNVAGLLASSLNVTDANFEAGIASAITNKSSPSNPYAQAALQPFLDSNGNAITNAGYVTVQAGAQITAADNGRVILAAPTVQNGGTITAPDGQIILAAGQSVYLVPSTTSDLRGFIVQVDGTGNVANQVGGTLSAPRGNISLVGLMVNQDGRISATTTVSANGSITLEAANGAAVGTDSVMATQGGTLEIGANSITEILPEYSDTTTAVADQTQLQSEINLTGQQVLIHGGTITAPSGQLNVLAATNPSVAATQGQNDPNAEIRVDSGTTIDLAGSDAVLPVSYNLLTVQLRGAELENDPTQRGGALQGQTVTVDIRADGGKGTPLADLSAELAAMPQNIAQRTETGGTATFKSEGDVVMGSGVSINVSGGQTTFTGGQIQTTELIGANGKLYDIGSASSLLTYSGLVNPTFTQSYNEWGVQQVVPTPGLSHYESGYVQGANAGTIQIAAPSLSIGASLLGSAVSGPYQRGLTTPLGGTLIIGEAPGALISSGGLADFLSPEIDFTSSVSPVVIPDGTPLPTQAVQLSTSYLTSDGFSNIQIYGNSRVTLPSGLPLDMPSGTSVLIEAPRIDVNSSISDLAGSLSFLNVATVDSSDPGLPRLGVGIGAGVTLDVSGQWTNDNLQLGAVGTGLTLQNAGSIEVQLNTPGSALSLGSQVSLKADGGAWLESNGTLADGKGGSITLDANPAQAALQIGQADDIEGFGVGTASGGTFSLTAPRILITQGTGTAWTSAQTVDDLNNPGGVLNVYAPLFSDYGFSTVSLTATGAATGTNSDVLTLASNTTIDALTRSWVLDAGFQNNATGAEVAGFAQTVTLPEYSRPVTDVSLNVLREAPLTLTVQNVGTATLGNNDLPLGSTDMGSLDIEAGASILTDPGATISLQSVGSLNIAGTLRAPGGDISATISALTNSYLDPGYQSSQDLFVAPTAVLDVSGTSILQPNALNLPLGQVLEGGTVTLDAQRGYVVVAPGSFVNISGTSAVLDVLNTTSTGGYELETVGSAGGIFSISSPESISLLGALEGTGGVGTAGAAAAGALIVDLTRLAATTPGDDPSGQPLPQFPDSTPLEIELVDSTQGQTPSGGASNLAVLGVQQINASGIDSLSLATGDENGTVTGVVSINTNEPLTLDRQLTISSPVLTVAPGYNAVLSAPYVQIGSSLESSTLTPTSGVGNLTVNTAQLNLLGNFTLQSMASTTFNSSGDVQLEGVGQSTGAPVGELNTAGNLTINAERIYPDTNTAFTLSSVPTDGSPTSITLGQAGASPGAPLSAAGTLSVSAPNIEIGGSLYAPFGTINLAATNQLTLDNNSLVSVSGAGLEIPYGETQYQGGQWIYTNPGSGQQVISGTPTKAVTLTAPQIKMGSGATVDLSGGGDLYAYEFVPGTTGLTDNLASGAISGLYAIIPAQRGLAAPYDPQMSGSSSQTLTVYLSGYAGLAAGYYALLPARYGLLPGADLIEVEPSYTSAIAGRIGTLADGTPVVAGYMTSGTTGLFNSTTQYEGFAIYPGSYSQKLASYTISDASTYFSGTSSSTSAAVPVPADGGTLSVSVLAALNNSLDLEGKVLTAAAKGGSGAQVNISASDLAVTSGSSGTSGSGVIAVSGSVLQGWNPASLTLGGVSSTNTSGTTIAVTADKVTIDTGVNLSADQITVVAQQGIEVQQGATLASTSGAAGTTLKTLPTATAVTLTDSLGNSLPGAALLSVSDVGLAEVTRTGTPTGVATITLDPGSTLKSGGALALDTPGQITTSGANINGTGASWSLSSSSVAFVNSSTALPQGDADTLNIDSGLLSSLQQAGAVRIASAGNIDLHTSVSLGATSAGSTPTLTSLTLVGSTITNEGGGNVVLGASTLTLQGSSVTATPTTTGGSGNLTLVANTLQVGPGAVTVNGFTNTLAQVGGAFEGYETGSLNVSGGLQINAVELTAIPGAPFATSSLTNSTTTNTALSSDTQYISNTTIASTGALTIGAPTQLSAGTALPTALGGSLSLQGTSIEDDGAIVTPSGIVNLNATSGNIHLAGSASINASGQSVAIAAQTTSSPGGMVTLTANATGASVTLDAGSNINVAGAGSDPAGTLSITGAGVVDISGTLTGQAGTGTGGSFVLNAGSLKNGLTSLANTLNPGGSGGFTNAIGVEVGSGDLDLASGASLTANNVVLSADTGAVDIAGTITANSGAQRGFIGIYGGGGAGVTISGQLTANGSGSSGRGGEIDMGTDLNGTCGTCAITFAPGSQISAQGSAQMGELVLQAPTLGAAGVNINPGSGGLASVVGNNVGQVIIEPLMTFNEPTSSSASINITSDVASDINTAETYVSGASGAILTALAPSSSQPGAPTYSVQTGVVVQDSNAGQAVSLTGSNLYSQYSSQGNVVDLTVRAAGGLTLNGVMSDGYTTGGQYNLPIAASTASGTLSFVAGANINSANPLATLATSTAGLSLATGAVVRTGTGDINLAAAGDVAFGKGASAYTIGLEASTPVSLRNSTTNYELTFADNAGNVSIRAGDDVTAQALTGTGNYSVTGWQLHEGNTTNQTPAQYGISLAGFDWNVGALGGGDVTVVATKGNITELSAATADSMTADGTTYGTGGGLSMTAGGDIGSVQVYVSSGAGTVTAGGGLTAPVVYKGANVGSTFALGDATIAVWARNSVLVDAVYNPTALEESSISSQPLYGNYFTYGTTSAISLESTTGNVGFEVQPTLMPGLLGTAVTSSALSANAQNLLEDLPPNLTIQALQGDINLDLENETFLFPTSTGQLTLLAGRDITNSGVAGLVMADNVASTVPTVAATHSGQEFNFQQFVGADGPINSIGAVGAEGNIHAGDTTPVVIAAGRDIDNLTLNLPKAAQIVAGRDVYDLSYIGLNANASDVTLISAGRDLTDPGGNNTDSIQVGGQGALDVFAGRDVNLGVSYGITTSGNLLNPNLPSSSGADVTVMAGLGSPQDADDANFLQTIIAPSSTYQSELISYVESESGKSGLTFQNAETAFKGLSQPLQQALIDQVFFNELLLSGREANSGTGVGFTRGYAAIDALFPTSRTDETETSTGSYTGPYSGDLDMIYSQIYTQSGGNINILTPGGQINVGLAVAPSTAPPHAASQLGIVAEGAGNIDIYSLGSVNVNASRIFTLGGGNILIWSDLGNIDAGNGSKASLSIPPPTVSISSTGVVTFNYTGAVAGSGIRTIQTASDQAAGSVDLDAPVGTVDAGDAGIGAAGNINIAAQRVIGASNINFGGTATGVPPEVSSLGASLSGATAAATSSATTAESKAQDQASTQSTTAPQAQAALSWLDVFVTGVGEENCKPEDTECLSRQKAPQ